MEFCIRGFVLEAMGGDGREYRTMRRPHQPFDRAQKLFLPFPVESGKGKSHQTIRIAHRDPHSLFPQVDSQNNTHRLTSPFFGMR